MIKQGESENCPINMLLSQVKRLESDMININKKIDTQKSKESKAIEKIAKAQKKLMNAKLHQLLILPKKNHESASRELSNAQNEQGKLSKQLSDNLKTTRVKEAVC